MIRIRNDQVSQVGVFQKLSNNEKLYKIILVSDSKPSQIKEKNKLSYGA